MGGDRINLSRALSLLHHEGADWDPKASEWLQEVQFIIFNGEEQEVETWSWAPWFIHRLSRCGGGASLSPCPHLRFAVTPARIIPLQFSQLLFNTTKIHLHWVSEHLRGNNMARICLSNHEILFFFFFFPENVPILIYYLLLMSSSLCINTRALISYCWCLGGAALPPASLSLSFCCSLKSPVMSRLHCHLFIYFRSGGHRGID